ncbi:Cmx/CmrA family chloramphenicol efflux MFS transporter [Nocardioides nitrophenolicus]|uniref:Cmx/CmrA family chloramphenicol efflux MFS transporter n=1 Tax=Nocardioides nitrophenolicus TaxID=60489 RepID=UPI00195CBA99|nr:Cmx/CmrA family chloramphenicol efflux MFS transporter [Nocardioides nitrophenolicus]MBM7515197.1 DHA1 family chloramphenicol resistance protein-like MFS transporter [Nocardioides nitrophenolicus]
MPLALYLLALAVFAMGTSEFMLAGLVPDIAADIDVSVGSAGLLTSAFAVGMVLGAPLMAAVARRWPARSALLGCVAVFALCHVVAATTASFTVLFGTRVVAAVANAGFLAVALSTAIGLVATDQKGRALAVLLSGTTLATVAGVPAGALLGTTLGWRAAFWAVALLCVPAGVAIVAGIRPGVAPASEVAAGPSLASELAALRAPRLLLAMALGALVNGGTFAVFTFVAPLVTGTAGLDEIWVPLALVLFGVGSFLGVTVAGRLSDRHSTRLLDVATPVLLLGWLALGVTATRPLLVLGLVLVQGVVAFAVGSTLIARVLHAAAGAPTMAGSYATAALNLGATAGPAVAAVSRSGSGDVGPVWVAAVLTGIALLLLLTSRRADPGRH